MEEIDFSKFENISPYTDAEASAALAAIADLPFVKKMGRAIFPNKAPLFLSKELKKIKTIDQFQKTVIITAVEYVIKTTMNNFSYDGIKNIPTDKKFILMSNHRDIILDPALTQCVFNKNGLPTTEICVGDNLLQNELITSLIRSNRMIKVVRGISARELYLSSQLLSEYIRLTITSGKASVWIAQRQGRTKDGIDITEQGLLRMLDLSGTKDFVENYEELCIIPCSISYEYEPCAILKAQENLIKKQGIKYEKAPGEDINSIITGLKQYKGNVHLSFGLPLSHEEIESAAKCENKQDKYQTIRQTVDLRVIQGYRLYKTNYMAYDLLTHTNKYVNFYTQEDLAEFNDYLQLEVESAAHKELSAADLMDEMLSIYANPIISKEQILFNNFNIQDIKYF